MFVIACPNSSRGKWSKGLIGRCLWLAVTAGLLTAACLMLLAGWWEGHVGASAHVQSGLALPGYPGPLTGKGQALMAYTDRGRAVCVVYYPDQPAPSPERLAAEKQWLCESGLSAQLVRMGPPSDAYVCYDWVFTGGRYMVLGDPQMILEDNGYEQVALPRAGDLAVYRDWSTGALMHTGVVHSDAADGTVLVESKWAWMGRYLHPAGVYCYPGAVCTFYRSPRPGHLLRGLDGLDHTPQQTI